MKEFISLKQLRNRVWPVAVAQNLATDMTGSSLPILYFQTDDTVHPYQVLFLLYYAVPDANIRQPSRITRPYAFITLDLQTGELVNKHVIRDENEPKPLIGAGASNEIVELPDAERRMLQELFFSRCEEAAQIYADGDISPSQSEHLADLLGLFENLCEPPLREDYEEYGKPFFSWLRQHAQDDVEK